MRHILSQERTFEKQQGLLESKRFFFSLHQGERATGIATFPPYDASLLVPTTYFGGKWRLFQNVSVGRK
ncbi:hypothetical protein CEXT_386911 [Caerostris extrusa]|uniref:Uncharacterized protein n=1 Tax=Caerostris extrusa TaxID=172846 RepID=A0AAV4P630_CAEEX|nr:hypothetical protein CEXT_386911 [Caerostris extrusa]